MLDIMRKGVQNKEGMLFYHYVVASTYWVLNCGLSISTTEWKRYKEEQLR